MAEYTVRNNCGVVAINHPPLNSLSTKVRQDLCKFIRIAETDDKIKGLIICGKGKTFPVGADVTEFANDGARSWPPLPEVIDIIESSEKPVIAAIHGYALGGGLEIALGAHYRIASSSAKFGFPEVNIGILPGAGGTQRFPRLVGIKAAMDWISSGKHYTAHQAASLGLLDKVFPASSDIVTCAVEYLQSIVNQVVSRRRVSLMPIRDAAYAEDYLIQNKQKLAVKGRGAIAPHVCLQSVYNSLTLSFTEGLKKEMELFQLLNSSGQAKALQYAFFSERFVSKWEAPNGANYRNSKPMKVHMTAVIGLGTMGSGIAIALTALGKPVLLLETNRQLLEGNVEKIRGIVDRMKGRGEISDEECQAIQSNLIPCESYDKLKDVDLVVEAVFESMELKKQIFAKLNSVCKPSAILATNTSTLDIDVLASQTTRPDKVAGMHFFAPPHRMKLLENIRGMKSSAQTLATIMDVGRRINKCTVLVGNCFGFAANRMYSHMMMEADYLIEDGAYPQQVDAVMREYGFAMGRFEIADLSGSDVNYRVRHSIGRTRTQIKSDDLRFCPLSDYLYELGRYGVKTGGRGWYKLVDGKFEVDDEIIALIDKHRKDAKIEARKIQEQEILERVLYPIINEGFKLLEEGIASHPQVLDMIWLYGFSWPKHTGGPMYYAQTVGLPRILNVIEKQWERAGPSEPHWKPSKMLVTLVKRHGNPPLNKWMELSALMSAL